MKARARICLATGLLGLTACAKDQDLSISRAFENWMNDKPVVKTPDMKKFPAAETEVAERVELLGRKIINQNTFTGLDPLFHTIGRKDLILFHRGPGEVFISEGLVAKCKDDSLLAALLCTELGKMMAEKQPATTQLRRRNEPIPDEALPGGVTASDQTRAAELGTYERKNPKYGANAADPIDCANKARELLKGAGFDPNEFDRAAPLLQDADRNETLQKQMAGSGPTPQWKW